MKPAELPAIRRALIRTYAAMLPHVDAEPTAAGMVRTTSRALPTADLYHVSQAMTRVAVDAARDVPSTPLGEVWPSLGESTAGVMACAGGLPPVDVAGTSVAPEVMTWATDGSTGYVGLHVRGSRLAGAGGPEWVSCGSAEASLTEPLDLDAYRPTSVRAFSLALAAWVLMATPTVAEARDTTQAGPKLGHGRRDTPSPVKIIDLRRMARAAATTGDGGRSWTAHHQWVVRGHWRRQPYGQGHALRRTVWVPSYLKGPQGAPLLEREAVFAWRR